MQYIFDPKGKTGLTSLLGNPQVFNFYTYASNNPINLTDPTGMLTSLTAFLMPFIPGLKEAYIGALALSYSLQSSDPITSGFFGHSLALNPGDVNINEKNQSSWGNVIEQIKGTDEFQSKIGELISNAEANGLTSISGEQGQVGLALNETSDLKMAIGTANMQVNGTQSDDGSWALNVTVSDTYHFDSSYSYDGGLGYNAANKVAATAQGAGIISTYNETINFSTTHE